MRRSIFWPRGASVVLRDLRLGEPVDEVARIRRYPPHLVRRLHRRLRSRRVVRDEAGGVMIILALVMGAWAVLALGVLGVVSAMADHRIAQACADHAALAAVVSCPQGDAMIAVNGCGGKVDCGATTTAVATHGSATATATAASDPVRLTK